MPNASQAWRVKEAENRTIFIKSHVFVNFMQFSVSFAFGPITTTAKTF